MNVHRSLDPDASRNGTLASMCLALVLVVASVASVNLALTGISIDLGATSSQLTWIADGYTVALAALVLPFGALGDLLGRRTILLVGTVVFGVASLMASFAQSARTIDRLAGRDGHRCSDDHAGHSVDDHGRVLRVQARPGRQRVGRLRQLRRDPRHADLRRHPRVVVVAGNVPRNRCCSQSSASSQRSLLSPNSADPRRGRHRRAGLSCYRRFGVGTLDLRHHLRRRETAGPRTAHADRPRCRRRHAGCVRLVGAADGAARCSTCGCSDSAGFSTGTVALTDPVPLPVRLLLRRSAVPAADARLQPAAQRRRACCPMGAIVMPVSTRSPRISSPASAQRAVMTSGLLLLAGGLAVLATMDALVRLLALPRRPRLLRLRHGPHVDAVDHRNRHISATSQAGCRVSNERRVARARLSARHRDPRVTVQRRLQQLRQRRNHCAAAGTRPRRPGVTRRSLRHRLPTRSCLEANLCPLLAPPSPMHSATRCGSAAQPQSVTACFVLWRAPAPRIVKAAPTPYRPSPTLPPTQ